MYYKKLVGNKCYLSPIDINDAEKFTAWLNDMELLQNIQLYSSVVSLESEKILLNDLSKNHNYSIVDIEKEQLLGNCGFFDIDHVNRTAETGIFIGNKDNRDNGYGTEALSLLIDYGFKALNLNNIMLKVYEFNKRAIRCYEKIGFRPMGKRRKALFRNLEQHDIIFMDILPNEFYEIWK